MKCSLQLSVWQQYFMEHWGKVCEICSENKNMI
jgi:hypothetical protein